MPALIVAMIASIAGPNGVAGAAELRLDAGLNGRVEYSDNILLRFDPVPSWRVLVEPTATLVRSTESNQISARAKLGFNRYSSDIVPDATDRALNLAGTQSFDRGKVGLNVDLTRLSSQSAQVLGQTGINIGRRQIDSASVMPSWAYSVSPRTSLNASGTWTTTRFEQTTQAQVTDFRTTSATVGSTWALSERSNIGLSVSYLDFDTSPFVSRSKSWSANATLDHTASPTFKWSATVGLQRVSTQQNQVILICPVDPIFCQLGLVAPIPSGFVGESTQLILPFNLNAQWQVSERDSATAAFIQRVSPSGVGGLTAGFQINASYRRAFAPTLDGAVTGGYVRTRALGGAAIGDVLSISPTLNWRISQPCTLTTGYIHTRLTYPSLDRTVAANAVFVSLSYGWPQWTIGY